MFDIIVVGARCAGASTAMLLSRMGHKVLLLDRNRFPSDKLSTHYIHQSGVARLGSWGLVDDLKKSGCPPLRKTVLQLEDVRLSGCVQGVDGIRVAYGPRRFILDAILFNAATAARADARESCNVTGLLRHGDRISGVEFQAADGRRYQERSRLVIGADGINSMIAREVNATAYEEEPSLTCVYYTYWSEVPAEYEIYVGGRRGISILPTNDGLTMVAAMWPRALFRDVRVNIENSYLTALRHTAPAVFDRVLSGKREERFFGTGYLPNYFRPAAGLGWALVGDAGHHKDPIGGDGISDAFEQADLLSRAAHTGLTGEADLDSCLSEYARERDRRARPSYRFTIEAAKLAPSEDLLSILRVVQTDQDQVDRYFGVIAGVVEPEDFFTEELLELAAEAAP
jgi:2-polyprenyl-6-methoxyphenol hydroxylase-like FAD-dependent oxidoreductase